MKINLGCGISWLVASLFVTFWTVAEERRLFVMHDNGGGGRGKECGVCVEEDDEHDSVGTSHSSC